MMRRPNRPLASGANDPEAKSQKSLVANLAVPNFINLDKAIIEKAEAVKVQRRNLSLEEVTLLMQQVQSAQRELTKSLNSLSNYRKTVAELLQERRQERAKARRAGGETANQPQAPFAIDPNDFIHDHQGESGVS